MTSYIWTEVAAGFWFFSLWTEEAEKKYGDYARHRNFWGSPRISLNLKDQVCTNRTKYTLREASCWYRRMVCIVARKETKRKAKRVRSRDKLIFGKCWYRRTSHPVFDVRLRVEKSSINCYLLNSISKAIRASNGSQIATIYLYSSNISIRSAFDSPAGEKRGGEKARFLMRHVL